MLQKKNRTVSCIIPTYKRTNTLYRAIESVRNQTYSNLEILVVNDNDKDNEITYQIKEYIEALNDDRIVFLQVEEHLNGARTRNIGINYSRGEYIAFLDDDDEWCESKIEKQINYFDNNNSVFGLTSQYTLYKNNKVLRTPVIQKSSDIHFDIISRRLSLYTSTSIFYKNKLIKSGVFDEKLKRHQDLQLFLDFSSNYELDIINEVLVKIHSDDTINRPNTEQLIMIKSVFFERISKHYQLYDRKHKRRIKSAHNFEILFSSIKEKKILKTFKYLLLLVFYPRGFIDVWIRYKQRKM